MPIKNSSVSFLQNFVNSTEGFLSSVGKEFKNLTSPIQPGFGNVKQSGLPAFNLFAEQINKLIIFLTQFDPILFLFVALLVIGLINWTIWFIRRTRSMFYHNFSGNYIATTSVVIPVYREKPGILKETINSILLNKPEELILVLDHTEKDLMSMIQEDYKFNWRVKPFFIERPGKRPALVDGIREAKGEIVVLVDSDTSWASGDFLENLLAPFKDPKVGGVGTRQVVRSKWNLTHRLIDWVLDLKYSDYIASDSLSGSVLCLSGRTAAYRREIILPLLDNLEHERFLWHKCVGGDDARLTTLVLQQGYKTVYQGKCIAQSEFSPSITTYLKQKIRWSRNSFRTYIKSIFSPWPWKQRRFYYLMAAYHTIIPGLTMLIGLFFFAYSIYLEAYIFSIVFVLWIFISRTIKSYSHLKKYPRDIPLLPFVTLYYYFLSFIKLYAFFTMTHERWAGSRGSYKISRGKRR